MEVDAPLHRSRGGSSSARLAPARRVNGIIVTVIGALLVFADVLNHEWFLWGLLGFEGLLLLVGLLLRVRIRIRTTLLVISLIANAYLGLIVMDSIFHSAMTKLLVGVAWPLLNLAWLVWVWRSRSQKQMAEPPTPVKPQKPTKGAQKPVETPPAPRASDLGPPTAKSATLDLRKIHEEAKAKAAADAKKVKIRKQL
jgi:hypothetical protein